MVLVIRNLLLIINIMQNKPRRKSNLGPFLRAFPESLSAEQRQYNNMLKLKKIYIYNIKY